MSDISVRKSRHTACYQDSSQTHLEKFSEIRVLDKCTIRPRNLEINFIIHITLSINIIVWKLTPWLMEPGGSMPHSQGLSNNSYPEPNQPNYPQHGNNSLIN